MNSTVYGLQIYVEIIWPLHIVNNKTPRNVAGKIRRLEGIPMAFECADLLIQRSMFNFHFGMFKFRPERWPNQTLKKQIGSHVSVILSLCGLCDSGHILIHWLSSALWFSKPWRSFNYWPCPQCPHSVNEWIILTEVNKESGLPHYSWFWTISTINYIYHFLFFEHLLSCGSR